MKKAFSFLLTLAVSGALWCSLFSCTSLQGEMAPPVVGGTIVVDGFVTDDASLPQTDWRLLAFFSPT